MWRFRYKRPGSTTRTTITLGYYPVMSLASARTLHAEKLALLVQGVDPGKQAREAAAQEKIATDSLFINVATKWFALKKPEAFQMSMRTISGNRWKRMCFRPSGRHFSHGTEGAHPDCGA
ncbi:integrase arm-type DNA-binding domain-containing protein [Escherichia coli]